jgi:hypothetical protein
VAVDYVPPGINGLAAFDRVSRIWVRGSQEGQDELSNFVEYLNRPRQRIEYQVQLIELPLSIAQTFTAGKPAQRLSQSLSASVINNKNRKVILVTVRVTPAP